VVCTEETLHHFSAGVLNSLRRRREWMLAAAAHGAAAEGPAPRPCRGCNSQRHVRTRQMCAPLAVH
jgi:hypothetical protein